jgi:hypothetical protein
VVKAEGEGGFSGKRITNMNLCSNSGTPVSAKYFMRFIALLTVLWVLFSFSSQVRKKMQPDLSRSKYVLLRVMECAGEKENKADSTILIQMLQKQKYRMFGVNEYKELTQQMMNRILREVERGNKISTQEEALKILEEIYSSEVNLLTVKLFYSTKIDSIKYLIGPYMSKKTEVQRLIYFTDSTQKKPPEFYKMIVDSLVLPRKH